jgi:uncharacterized protein (DUF2164 family)
VKRGKEISENRYKVLDIENKNMIDKLHKYLIKKFNVQARDFDYPEFIDLMTEDSMGSYADNK